MSARLVRVGNGAGHLAVQIEAILEFEQPGEVGRLRDVRFQSLIRSASKVLEGSIQKGSGSVEVQR